MMRRILSALIPLFIATGAQANLLRNADLQDDWLTVLSETKNHHWCYSSEIYNRRDFNPDSWRCTGSWQWLNADGPYGQRRFIMTGPSASISQQIYWLMVHDDRKSENFPDAGGFPAAMPIKSDRPAALMRDLTLRILVKGQDVPTNAATVKFGWPSQGKTATQTVVTVSLPEGSYDFKWVEYRMSTSTWFKAVTNGTLPMHAQVGITYNGKAGQIEIVRVELTPGASTAPNLLANGGFETLDKKTGYPTGWGQQEKYRYFPPRYYYIFNTWHNAQFPNRGPVGVDALIAHNGANSLKMIVAAGDEKYVASDPIVLNQKDPRVIEVTAWVRTDRLCMMQIDAMDQDGKRLDGINFIHKAPVSIGTEGWRMVRQIFRPRTPVKSIRLQLCARGVNGYTLDDTTTQPQNTVVGTIWWDDVRVSEPESTAAELAKRDVETVKENKGRAGPQLAALDLGERLLGDNVLSATLTNAGKTSGYSLQWEFTSPTGKKSQFNSAPGQLTVPYTLSEPCEKAYTEYRGTLSLLNEKGKVVNSNELWFGTWDAPVNLQIGSLYMIPEQKQLVRMNFGLTQETLKRVKSVRLEVIRRGTGKVVKQWDVPATPEVLLAQRDKIPNELRGEFANLLLTDFDASFLPLQPFNDPQRNWFLRATIMDNTGKSIGTVDSQPFCRLAHDPKQPPIEKVKIKNSTVYINDKPWIAWGAIYGFCLVYDGPADPGPGKYRDLHNVPEWSIYDRYGGNYSRSRNDFNCARYVEGAPSAPKELWNLWSNDNRYCSSAFGPKVVPGLGKSEIEKLPDYLAFVKTAPMVVSMASGIEEAFGYFHILTDQQLKEFNEVGTIMRKGTDKPVMVGHGGYWNRLEFERAMNFDIYDPETEPLYPGNIHVDLAPLVEGRDAVVWLRPQMYEDVPYERWRFHAFVELMRGCRGWQFAHGPGDQSLFRGLHGEMEFMKNIVVSTEAGPAISIEPSIEHYSRVYDGKLYIVAATTHGMTFGNWQESGEADRSRVTCGRVEARDESNGYGLIGDLHTAPAVYGIQNLPDAQKWPEGTKVVQYFRVDPKAPPHNLVAFVRGDARWTHAAVWGKIDFAKIRNDTNLAYAFLTAFYRHSKGFLGWDTGLVSKALQYIPEKAVDMGAVPATTGEWVRIEVPMDKIGAIGKLVDGIAFLHEDGRVWWGHTSIVTPDGKERMVWGDQIGESPEQLAHAKITVPGLKAGAKIRVVFEDRELKATEAGSFTDDFRGKDLYQRYGGGPTVGYGDTPVALHIYELKEP